MMLPLFIILCVIALLILAFIAAFLIKTSGTSKKTKTRMPANEIAGLIGEVEVISHLESLLSEDEHLLPNLLLPLKNGSKTEIDCVLISHKGIFCIEIKNWSGPITGGDEDDSWIQKNGELNGLDRSHRNPVKQNKAHSEILEKKLDKKYSVNNCVIFSNLSSGSVIYSDHTFSLRQFVNHYKSLPSDKLNAQQIASVFQKLLPYVASKEELADHAKEIKRKHSLE